MNEVSQCDHQGVAAPGDSGGASARDLPQIDITPTLSPSDHGSGLVFQPQMAGNPKISRPRTRGRLIGSKIPPSEASLRSAVATI